MLADVKHAKEIWGGSLSIIDSWLNARQTIVVLYCDLAGISANLSGRKLPEQAKITEFCGLLLDYASKGHFEIYEQIVAKSKLDGEENLKLAQELYSRITTTTDTALNFNDKYSKDATDEVLADFDADLSKLGEVMEDRFKREDQLLKVVHLHHTLS